MSPVRRAAKGAKQRTVSTSEVRKQLAGALRTVKQEKVLIGFGRYGACVAVLAPVEAAFMLAGRGAEVKPELRAKIKAIAEAFADDLQLEDAPAAVSRKAARTTRKAPGKKAPKTVAKKSAKARRKPQSRR
ncbi:MAG TPA: hypothetical protein DHW63_01735 [Hyphomonadaceae bacterium]|nr:hypothetical protein [Hyphomonadaceae bacterium]